MFTSNCKWIPIVVIAVAGCAESPPYTSDHAASPPSRKTAAHATYGFHQGPNNLNDFVVKKGDTLYSIGYAYGLTYQLLAEWNNIPKPYLLQIGQRIKLYDPKAQRMSQLSSKVISPAPQNGKSTTTLSASTAVKKPPLSPAKSTPQPSKLSSKKSIISEDKQKMLKLHWRWPIEGKLLKNFAQTGSKGIDIKGKSGQSVLAAASGEVVYSGNGLLGYGNLLIIKHDALHLSAYANNASLHVQEGQKVNQGQLIARCGESVSGVPSLHFEIRKNGKSVNPLLYLPSE